MNAQATITAKSATEAAAKKEPKLTHLPYMGDEYSGGSLTVNIPGDVLSSRDGTGWNGRGFSVCQ